MYAWAKDRAAHDLARHGVAMERLPAEEQFYWGTLYFNAGPERARRLMNEHGPGLARTPWPHGEDAAYRMDARYNASWRTATYELIRPLTDTAPGGAKRPWE
jgi:hypothetical protein